MLASITPLGERSRGNRWAITAVAFTLGAVLSGACAGALLGGLGSLPPQGAWRGWVLLAAVAVTAAFELPRAQGRLPSSRRQVNEDWLGRFRGTVYGAGFGAQLGLGVATIVTSAAVYAAGLAAFLSGSATSGLLVGLVFGGLRAASLLPARRAVDALELARLHTRLAALADPVRRGSVLAELALLAGLAGAVL